MYHNFLYSPVQLFLTGRAAQQNKYGWKNIYVVLFHNIKIHFSVTLKRYSYICILPFRVMIKQNSVPLKWEKKKPFILFLHKHTKTKRSASNFCLILWLQVVILHPQSSHPSCHPPHQPPGEHKQFAVISVPLPI